MPTIVTITRAALRLDAVRVTMEFVDDVDFGSHRHRPDDCATPQPDDEAGTASTSLPDRRKPLPRTLARRNSADRAIDRRDEP